MEAPSTPFEAPDSRQHTVMDARIQIVINLMEANFQRKLRLSELARAVNLSPSRLRHLFKSAVGATPAQYLRSLRIAKARELIETSLLSVKEVMARVGLSDESHFVRDFKRAFGLPPAQYRARYARIYSNECSLPNKTAKLANE